MFKFIVNCLLNFNCLRGFSCEFLSFLVKSDHLFINKLETVIDRKVLADVIDNQIDSALEDPR